jgi:hypothetical protein
MVTFRADGESFGLVSGVADRSNRINPIARPSGLLHRYDLKARRRSFKIGAGGDKHPFCRLDATIEAAYPPGSNSA